MMFPHVKDKWGSLEKVQEDIWRCMWYLMQKEMRTPWKNAKKANKDAYDFSRKRQWELLSKRLRRKVFSHTKGNGKFLARG